MASSEKNNKAESITVEELLEQLNEQKEMIEQIKKDQDRLTTKIIEALVLLNEGIQRNAKSINNMWRFY